MTPPSATGVSFRFSSDRLPEAARASTVRALHEHTGLPGEIEPLEPLSDCPVRVDIAKLALPGLGIMTGTLEGLRQAARPRGSLAGSSRDELLLAINLRGRSVALQHDKELVLQDGDAMLATRGMAGFTIIRPAPARIIGLRVPRAPIAPLVGRLEDAPFRLVPRGAEILSLLVAYAGAVASEAPPRTQELQALVVTHIHDLIAVAVGATKDSLAMAQGRGVRAARLRAIMSDIRANLGECGLTAAAVAGRQRITARYVHKLFESEGLSFSEFVLGLRLARVHQMLCNPRLCDLTIGRIAFEVGFGDLSYFNRAFRRRYGATPSDIRKSAVGTIKEAS